MVSRQARSNAVNSAGGFMNDFREFLLRGNVVDLAVAVVIGGAFGAVITSFIEDIITPLLLNPALKAANVEDIAALSANGIKYGLFLSTVINFVVIAFILFILIRTFERMKRTEEVDAAPTEPTTDEKLNDTLGRLTGFLEQRM
ncbi:large conductance mechanosensitive channel protein MscL [Leptolyngbya cf. ectocarpi LEGE 11479]|uniref:Large-conductance mechanosensitive channel n=1 Tax=Leptolyngbya cf. ectocarpi LEGE 11479 TaxID=1828722 RepID=A0A928ZTJ0_LEPEC|nr:large conductance mechanosensitive channel protein MscL [Leptolyngbya ectocarpi]MBE9065729.1 large conductance mechanosensitive channel protein MscL [Leptolyngbya cf. ectocarpi LEGE 11479]